MMLANKKIGFAITGSFCSIQSYMPEIENLIKEGADVFPIVSNSVKTTDTRFGLAKDTMDSLTRICNKPLMETIVDVEPIGPKGLFDILVVAPCTGNTLSKVANAITDTSVTMAVKAHLRNLKPLVIAISTNDALGANAINLGKLINIKHIYFVPYYQDNATAKPNSLVAETKLILPTIIEALDNKQIQPVTLR